MPSLAPERFGQFSLALSFADPGICQQARIEARQLAAAENTLLPGQEIGSERHKPSSDIWQGVCG